MPTLTRDSGAMSLNRDTLLGVLGGAALGAAAAALIQRVAVSRASSAGAGAPATVRSTTDSGVSGAGGGAAVYESAKATNEYLLFHYAKDAELLPYAGGPASALQFPRRTAQVSALGQCCRCRRVHGAGASTDA